MFPSPQLDARRQIGMSAAWRMPARACAAVAVTALIVATAEASQPNRSAPTTAPVARFRIVRVDPQNFSLLLGDAPIFILRDGHLARLRCSPDNDHWLGTIAQPIHLGWSPRRLSAAAVTDVQAHVKTDQFSITILGKKPQLGGTPFTTTITAVRCAPGRPLVYDFRSRLVVEDGAALRARIGAGHIEFLDIWPEAVFWPQRVGHDRELYQFFLFGDPAGNMLRAPKLHVFPSIRGATYETLVQEIPQGGVFGLIDQQEPSHVMRFVELSTQGRVGICWWTWDSHFFMDVPDAEAVLSYHVRLEELPAADGRKLLARAAPIPFRDDPDYQVPVFHRDTLNTFRKQVDRSDEWGWEPHSRACQIDRTVGFDDCRSVTIRSDTDAATAWYARAVGVDYFDHRRLEGGYRVTAQVRTRDVAGVTRLAVISYNGPETWLYQEPNPTVVSSTPLTGTNDWTLRQVQFGATGFKRFKIVLEQTGRGRSWFDNVKIERDPTYVPAARSIRTIDWRDVQADSGARPLDLRTFTASHPRMLADAKRLTMAWKECVARGPKIRLAAGRYQVVIRASGEGCPDDSPLLRAKVTDAASCLLSITPGETHDYHVDFSLPTEQVVQLVMTFVNDGECVQGPRRIDKNVFVEAITLRQLASVGAAPSPAPGV